MASSINRRDFLGAAAGAALVPPCLMSRFWLPPRSVPSGGGQHSDGCDQRVEYLPVALDEVPFPRDIAFTVHYPGNRPITLRAHYWYQADALRSGRACPAIVEFNPYRRRDGTLYADSMMYPWFARNGYLCFRVDLQGSGDSEGTLTDEYSEEELSYCVQVIEQIARLPFCDGNVGMMGKSWSAINSLMVAAREDCPSALKAIVVCCGTDDRYNDDVHYMGGAMMQDNVGWPSSIWGWLPAPPDPRTVGRQWKEIWRERIRNMSFWFEQWGSHQTRDSYWSTTSVRDHYDRVRVPVFILSGWQDGYKNPVERAVRALGELGRPVSGLLGPWGHKYPFNGYPGPRIDWLRYVVTHWWDRWLKGEHPDPDTSWPQLTVWLGESREPDRLPDYTEKGKWVAEDHCWADRVQEQAFFLTTNQRMSPHPASVSHAYISASDIRLGTTLLETSSFGECSNADLPGDQNRDDHRSIFFDSAPLDRDLECFGYPLTRLNLECDRPLASVAIRLSEVSPQTGASHLVTYRFFNLCYNDNDMAHPRPVPSGIFSVEVPLNIMGHVFKRGWKIRLSVSPSFFPTMWQSPEIPTVKLHTGPVDDLPPSALVLPVRAPRPQDARIQALLAGSQTAYVNPEQYVPTLKTIREASDQRSVERVVVQGKPGVLVHKVFDSGSAVYGGVLDDLLVDQTAEENFQILDCDPLSATGFTRSATQLQRADWKVRVVTHTRVHSEKTASGRFVFRYEADLHTFVADEPFEEKHIRGTIPRRWV
ncbi:CocE/NonD family hydrolase [Streptomyces sp. NPDC059455]|uniref:CocE/NonD family hydrolase n=1 Tax=Streptomyces sp. NPDC059455 TaxID=3346837 RepID=UPI0036A362DB